MNKNRYRVAVVLISAISMIDYQFIASSPHKLHATGAVRGIMHIGTMLLVMLLGVYAWKYAGILRRLWVLTYMSVLLFIITAGLAHYWLHILPFSMISALGFIRPFFCSPMPMFIASILINVKTRLA